MSNIIFNTLLANSNNSFVEIDPWYTPLTLTAEEANSTVKLTKFGKPIADGLQYRTNNSSDWTEYSIDTVITLPNIGDYVQFKNTKETLSIYSTSVVQFVMTGKIAGSGNIQSMLNYADSCSDYCYAFMFFDCTSLTSAPELPATTLAINCYEGMFRGCTSLTSAPELPATTLADYCYSAMFAACTSLTSASELPATTLTGYCYSGMFNGCTSLAKAPELPATTLAYECYSYMFENCISLVEAPELPATTLANYCYAYMFYGCTSLANAPELPATELTEECYHGMFERCTSLTKAPELPATELSDYYCYADMFHGCTSLNEIKVAFTDWRAYYFSTDYWLSNVSSTGTFYKPSALPEEYGDNRIPEGWTVVNIDET